jgi:hypothetical protein
MVIDEEEAKVVRTIFERYVAGATPREIAADLNAKQVPPPRGRDWNASTINGSLARSNGILSNRLYVGQIVWNRVAMVRNPDTGKRVSRPNPKSEWKTGEAPHLKIVDADLFEAANKRKQDRGGPRPQDRRKPRHLLSGLLRCGSCGGGMSVKDVDHGRVRIICTKARESGVCEVRTPFYLDTIEQAVVGGLRNRLTDRGALELYIRVYNEERSRSRSDCGQKQVGEPTRQNRKRSEAHRRTSHLRNAG